uniref:Fibronectin type-III domain-containing protein n=1 Tax=Strongyloides papillosus TaxID=174720 RepID=A0A0N5BRF5_STREA
MCTIKQLNILLFLTTIIIFSTKSSYSHPFHPSNIKNLKARYDANEDVIYVEWEVNENNINSFVIRYRYLSMNNNNGNQWKYIRNTETSVKLHDNNYKNGHRIEVQVRSETNRNDIVDWSKPLFIEITSKNPYNPLSNEEDNDVELKPPTNLRYTVVSPSSLKIEWDPVYLENIKIYYIVILQQQSSHLGENNYQRQQIKIEATSFAIEHLTPGESYEITIRTAISSQQTSTMAAVLEINMPTEHEFFEIENVIISSRFYKSGHGFVNITWEIPQQMEDKVSAYHVQYSLLNENNNFKQKIFRGDKPEIILDDLISNSEYKLTIKTILKNNLITESGEFLFSTPKVELDAMKKIDVIFSNNMDTVRLHWILADDIDKDNIEMYQIFYSVDKDLSLNKWNTISVPMNEENIKIDGLHENTVYYVRVRILTKDRKVLNSPTIYRFRTSDNYSLKSEVRQSNTLSYRNIGPGAIILNWNFDENIKKNISGTTILYSKDRTLSYDRWGKKNLFNSQNTQILLDNLEQGSKYFIQIIPHFKIPINNHDYIQRIEIQTDVLDSKTNWEFPQLNNIRRTKRLIIESMN